MHDGETIDTLERTSAAHLPVAHGGELIGVDIKQMKVVSAVKLGVPHPHTVAVVPSLVKAMFLTSITGAPSATRA